MDRKYIKIRRGCIKIFHRYIDFARDLPKPKRKPKSIKSYLTWEQRQKRLARFDSWGQGADTSLIETRAKICAKEAVLIDLEISFKNLVKKVEENANSREEALCILSQSPFYALNRGVMEPLSMEYYAEQVDPLLHPPNSVEEDGWEHEFACFTYSAIRKYEIQAENIALSKKYYGKQVLSPEERVKRLEDRVHELSTREGKQLK